MAAETRQDKENKSTVESMTQKAKETAQGVVEKGKSMASAAGNMADKGVSSAGQGISSVGSQMREHGPQEGMLGAANKAVAGTIERTGDYLAEEGLSGMAEDVTNVIRRYPVTSMLVGIGLGFLLARLTTTNNRSSY
jgi:hypothetical protein